MKISSLLLLSVWFFATVGGQRAFAAEPFAPVPVRVRTDKELLGLLLRTAWTWEREGNAVEEINFFDDGTAQHTSFSGKFKVTSFYEVELSYGSGVTKLTFDPTYTSYKGVDFNGTTPIRGTRKNDPTTNLSQPLVPISTAQFTQLLVGNDWTFEAPKVKLRTQRKFNADGTMVTEKGSPRVNWKVQNNKFLIIFSDDPGSPEIYHLPPRVFNPAGRQVRLEGTGSKLDAVNLSLGSVSLPTETKPVAPDEGNSFFGTKRPE